MTNPSGVTVSGPLTSPNLSCHSPDDRPHFRATRLATYRYAESLSSDDCGMVSNLDISYTSVSAFQIPVMAEVGYSTADNDFEMS